MLKYYEVSNTSNERKSRMPYIHGINGEVVVIYCEPLITKTPQESGRRPWGVIGFP
jgi:hypothetical protein